MKKLLTLLSAAVAILATAASCYDDSVLLAEILDLRAQVESPSKALVVIPTYTDGSVEASRKDFTISFDVIPEDAAVSLATLSTDSYELKVAYTLTKASPGDNTVLPIKKVGVKGNQLVVTADGSSLDEQLTLGGPLGANACLNIYDGNKSLTSGYFPLRFKSTVIKISAANDLQEAIDEADEGVEIRVAAGLEINGPIYLWNNVKLSGGWTKDFTVQDLNKRSCINGRQKGACVLSGWDNENKAVGNKNAVLSGFEIINGSNSGIRIHGKLTVEYCLIHYCFNSGQGGGICCSESSGDELLLANSIIEYNKADAHGGALAISGLDTKMTVVNCLFRGNASIAQYGYTGAIHGQAGVQAFLCNNTIVENVNWRDGSSTASNPWSAVMFRNSGTHIEMVNNIVAGNWYFLPGVASDETKYPNRYDMPIKSMFLMEMQVASIDLNEIGNSDTDYICRNNILGGTNANNFIGRAGSNAAREAAQKACIFISNDKYSTIFANAAGGNFKPSGASFGQGEDSDLVRQLLGRYTTDLAGKDRFSDGKIYIGCYQP